ncbi:hypothetical protein DBZ36_12795 [Alginatibacterium sediminis]|uniref:Uncharacterized protein n=1 Tax=Alginatibacterium sediminis TaxID=2164068 RepID=A0A420EBN1_9ALTE|nr:tetratricopeptide repeat protein [Alginatibacterium sediminis]RKF18107.1 hypothetical protein DBZ36_12795 [Alginatibacterium sediminis]
MTKLSCLYTSFIFGIASCISSTVQAYETGRINVDSSFQAQQSMLLSEPSRCLSELETKEPLSKANGKLLVESQLLLSAHKLAALCAFNDRNYVSAMNHINTAFKVLDPSRVQDHFELLLIQVLVQVKVPELAHNNENNLNQARQLIEKFSEVNTPSHNYQVERIAGNFYHRNGRSSEALQALLKAKEYAYASKDELLNAWAEYRLAQFYLSDNQNQLALTHFNAAASIVEKLGSNTAYYLDALSNREMALIYLSKQDFQKALNKQNQAIVATSKLPNPRLKADMLSSLGKIYNLQGEYASAVIPLMNARDFARKAKSLMLLSRINMYLGESYSNTGEYELALSHLQSARQQYQKQKNPSLELQVMLLLARLQLQQNEPALAVLQLQKAEQLANTIGLTHRNAEVYRLLALAYEMNDSFENALNEYKVFHEIDQQYQALSRAEFADDFKHHVQLMEQGQQLSEVTGLKAELELELQNLSQIAVTAISLLFLSVFAVLFLSYRNGFRSKRIAELTMQLEVNPYTHWQELLFHRDPLQQLRSHYLVTGSKPVFVALISVEDLRTADGNPISQHNAPLYFERLAGKAGDQKNSSLVFGHLGLHHALVLSDGQTTDGESLSKNLLEIFEQLHSQYGYKAYLSVAACPIPFLEKSPDALNNQTILQVLQLSLFALKKPYRYADKPNWISLKAQPWTPAAFFGDAIAQDLSNAIDKGLVKVKSSVELIDLAW